MDKAERKTWAGGVKPFKRTFRCAAAGVALTAGVLLLPGQALASDYWEELEWSQMETALMEGNSVEWHLDEEAQEAAAPAVPRWRIQLTSEQLDLLERCVMAEGGGESYECQRAIACVIVNRVLSDIFPDTVEEVIKQEGQFSTWPEQIESVIASNEVKQAVREALTPNAIPEDVLFFRADYYHSWGEDYCVIDHTYFSLYPGAN